MAGKQQHFIPKHFQLPFMIPDGKNKIWTYRRGQKDAYPVGLDRSACQNYFYSKQSVDGSKTLDDLITDYEENLTLTVEKIRSLEPGKTIDASEIAEIITHLSIRSSHMRDFINHGMVSMADAIRQIIEAPHTVPELDRPQAHSVPLGMHEYITKEFDERGLSELTPMSRAGISRLLYFGLRERISQFQEQAASEIIPLLSVFDGSKKNIGKHAQTQVLQESMAPEKRIQQLEKLNWSTEYFKTDDAILPDCTCIAFDGKKWSALGFINADDVEFVVLALSPSLLAVGSKSETPRLEKYNEFAASCCFSFFVSNQKTKKLERLHHQLGGTARLEIESITSNAVTSGIRELLNDDNLPKDDTSPAKARWSDCFAANPMGYNIRFEDCADQERATRISEVIGKIEATFSQAYPTHSLDGFTFAHDYYAALNTLDRGVSNTCEIIPYQEGDRVGSGMPLTVLRDGKIKTHIVLRGFLAEDLVSCDVDTYYHAAYTVIYMLADVAFTYLANKKFPDLLLQKRFEGYEGFIGQYTDGIFGTYFCTRLAAWNMSHLEFYRTGAIHSLQNFARKTKTERDAYLEHLDYELLYDQCAVLAAECLRSFARYHGLKAGLIGPHQLEQGFDDCLERYELKEWNELFGSDFAAFFSNIEDWSNIDELHFINRHFEHLD